MKGIGDDSRNPASAAVPPSHLDKGMAILNADAPLQSFRRLCTAMCAGFVNVISAKVVNFVNMVNGERFQVDTHQASGCFDARPAMAALRLKCEKQQGVTRACLR